MTPIRYNAYSSWCSEIVQTSASGSTFVPLGDFPCDEVVIFVDSASEAIDILASSKIVSAPTDYVTADSPSGTVIPVGGNANEIAVRRADESGTPTTVRYIWRKFMR